MNTPAQQFTPGPPMVRMASGQMVPAQGGFNKPNQPRKALVMIQFWNGDKDAAEELCSLIADLERVKNREADILLFGRSDATAPSRDIISKLEAKFERVMFERCRRAAPPSGNNSHPFACNQLFYDYVALFSQVAPWADRYYAFVNLETDCVPTRPGWIGELMAEWRAVDASGGACIGFIHDDPKRHMNGVGVYAIDIWRRVGSNKLGGGSPQIAYDIRHADSILPLAVNSPLFHFEFRRATISAEELFQARGQGVSPAIWHGVKDGSARAAVRARHVTFTEQREITRQTVLTFYEPSDYTNQTESAALLDLWRDAWKSRGWNPVVLSMRDAVKHGRYLEVSDRVERLPRVGPVAATMNRFMRWVALARVGGGLMVDYDLIPASFTPHDLPVGALALTSKETGKLCGLRLDRETAAKWLDAICAYDAQPGDVVGDKPCVTDATVLKAFEQTLRVVHIEAVADGSEDAAVIHFSGPVVEKHVGRRKSLAVEAYLRGG